MPSTIAFSTLKTSVKSRVFPYGTPENLDTSINNLIVEALVHVQRHVECLRRRNVDITLETALTDYCGYTILASPNGVVEKLVNRVTDDECDWFEYERVDLGEIEMVSKQLEGATFTCRLTWGNYAEDPVCRKILLVPQPQAGEQLELSWTGIKRSYADGDLVRDDPNLFAAVASYVSMENARRYDKDLEAFRMERDNFDNIIADMAYDCRNGLIETEACA